MSGETIGHHPASVSERRVLSLTVGGEHILTHDTHGISGRVNVGALSDVLLYVAPKPNIVVPVAELAATLQFPRQVTQTIHLLRKQITDPEGPTVLSTVDKRRNLGYRLDVDRVEVSDIDGKVVYDAQTPAQIERPFPIDTRSGQRMLSPQKGILFEALLQGPMDKSAICELLDIDAPPSTNVHPGISEARQLDAQLERRRAFQRVVRYPDGLYGIQDDRVEDALVSVPYDEVGPVIKHLKGRTRDLIEAIATGMDMVEFASRTFPELPLEKAIANVRALISRAKKQLPDTIQIAGTLKADGSGGYSFIKKRT